jgi:predicted dehydrogenase
MNPPSTPTALQRFMDRRGFMRSTALATGGSLLALTSKSAVAQQTSTERTIKCALIGCGAQGDTLRISSKDVPGIQWVAVADIWAYNRTPMARRMAVENKHQVEGKVNEYDTIEELLEKEKDVEAVFIAVPDFLHAPFSIQALAAGKHVYCEKMMSNTIEGARSMVKAPRKEGQIFQIGHQRHSNPRYIHFRDRVYKGAQLLGRVTHAYAQWNRGTSQSVPQGMPKGQEISQELLDKYGYKNALEFRNWRFFSKYAAGPISDLGAHQIDMFNWTFESTPVAVIATGGVDYYDGSIGPDGKEKAKFELPDNVMAIYEYKLSTGTARAYYQVLTTSSSQGAYEKYMGVNGSGIIAEQEKNGNQVYREANAPSWDQFVEGNDPVVDRTAAAVTNKIWEKPKPWTRPEQWMDIKGISDVRESKGLDPWDLPVVLSRRYHSPHIQNFIEACQTKNYAHLTCPVEMAFKTAVTVLRIKDSIDSGAKVLFKPEDFIA